MKRELFTILTAFALPVGAVMVATNESLAAPYGAGERVMVIEDVVGQGLDGSVVAREGATLWRTPNGLSVRLKMSTPNPGEYAYPSGGEAFSSDGDDPEVFSLWAFVFNDPSSEDWDGAFALSGGAVSGPDLTLNGYITRDTEPFSGEKLENPRRAKVHVALVPHGALDRELISEELDSLPASGPDIWWHAFFK